MIGLALLTVAALVAVGAKLARSEQRLRGWLLAQEEVWQAAVRACRLDPTSMRTASGAHCVIAHQGGRTITITPNGSTGSSAALITIEGLPKNTRIWRDSLRIQVALLVDTGRLALGDPEFDGVFMVEGERLALHAAFDAQTRRAALALFGTQRGASEGTGVERGVLTVRYRDDVSPPTYEPAELLRQALTLADRLSGERVEERLAAIVQADPIAAVRRLALEALHDERPADPATRRALEDACGDRDPLVRLTAGLALGPALARATLIGLTSAAEASDEVSARALAAVGPDLPADELRTSLSVALRTRRPGTATVCVDLLDRAEAAEPDVLAHLLERSDGALALAAARALGRCGTAAHVPDLRDAQKGAGGFGELAEACRAAVAAIQSRKGPDAPGQLSLAAGGGEVGLTDDARGGLGVAADCAGTTTDPTEPD